MTDHRAPAEVIDLLPTVTTDGTVVYLDRSAFAAERQAAREQSRTIPDEDGVVTTISPEGFAVDLNELRRDT